MESFDPDRKCIQTIEPIKRFKNKCIFKKLFKGKNIAK